jgi:hypothetical protein
MTRTATQGKLKTITQTPLNEKKIASKLHNSGEGKTENTLKKNATTRNLKENTSTGMQRSHTKGDLLAGKSKLPQNNHINNLTITNPSNNTKTQEKPKEKELVSVFEIDCETNYINTDENLPSTQIVSTKDEKGKKDVPVKKNEKINIFRDLFNLNKLLFIHKYLNKLDLINLFPASITPGRLCLQLLLENVKKEMEEAEAKLNAYKVKITNDLTIPSHGFPQFVMSRGANRAVELLNENIYNKIFSTNCKPSDDVILVYRIFFHFINMKDIASCYNNEEFWKKCSDYIINEGHGKTGKIF